MDIYKKNWFKFFFALGACLFVRLIPFRAPNVEPLLAAGMPFGKAYGRLAGFLFTFLSVLFYDAVTSQLGAWTLVTSVSYGFLGLWAAYYFKNRANSGLNYVKFAVMATIAFDLVTGLTVGPILFNQSLLSALVGQIPFTALHLAGNVSFAFLISPYLYRYLSRSQKLEPKLIETFNLKHA